MEKIIGRKTEIADLQRCYKSQKSEFVIVYGRRRIGKTFLVRSFFNDTYSFYYVGSHNISQEQQLENFSLALQKYGKSPFRPVLRNWFEAFDALSKLLEALPQKERKVVFIDEMPWIDSHKSTFVSALENFWNSWAAARDDVFFIACGSATSWMVDKLIKNKGGLHNRITNQIYLRPFNLKECEEYLDTHHFNWDRYQILECYMILGGIPYYLSLLNPEKSLAQNVDYLFYRKNAILRNEFDELYNALFINAEHYITVVKTLSEKKSGMTREEIKERTSLSGGSLSKILQNLEKCDFIISYSNYKNAVKNSLYKLIDFYTLFYYNFITGNNAKDEEFWTHHLNLPTVNTWRGNTFELVSLMHLDMIKQKLGISGLATAAYSWRSRDPENAAQIDLLIDRADRIINVCEMKFSHEPYSITKEYETKLRNRLAYFKSETKTTKGLSMTFVTTYGVLPNKHSGIVQNEVMMDDLFE